MGSKWVYKDKYQPNGCIERYNASFVAKDIQNEGYNFYETFVPVVKVVTIKIIIAIASIKIEIYIN